jgi:cysteine desulfurase/selenocysteine lyase
MSQPNTVDALPGATAAGSPRLDATVVADQFPILSRSVHEKRLAYLDNAATTQKPAAVIEAEAKFYRQSNANVHRGLHQLSQEASQAYEDARGRVAKLLNAADQKEIVFPRGATEAINLVTHSWARPRLQPGDEVLISEMEHHANLVPWQQVCQQTGARLRVIPMDQAGVLDMAAFDEKLNERTQLVAVSHASNALGTVNPVETITAAAHRVGAVVLIDGAQAVSHFPVDVRAMGCDFYVLSGHKLFGPTGIGALYGRFDLLQQMPPYQTGGEMVKSVSFDETQFHEPPTRFEAGTPNIAGAVGLGAAVDFVQQLGLDAIAEHDQQLLDYASEQLAALPGLRLIGTANRKIGILSFVLEGIHPHDAATILDQHGVAVRAGHHCAQPTMAHFNVPATIRVSLAPYNHEADIDALVAGLQHAKELFT